MLGSEERAVQGLFQPGDLSAHHAPGHLREHFRAALPAMIERSIARPETPWMSLITDDSFMAPVTFVGIEREGAAGDRH